MKLLSLLRVHTNLHCLSSSFPCSSKQFTIQKTIMFVICILFNAQINVAYFTISPMPNECTQIYVCLSYVVIRSTI